MAILFAIIVGVIVTAYFMKYLVDEKTLPDEFSTTENQIEERIYIEC